MKQQEPLINIDNLHKKFQERQVLDGVRLKVPRGCVFGLLGKNGAGKTTLIKIILGLIRATRGSVAVLGQDPWQFPEKTKSCLGYVPQGDRIYPWLTVKELVTYTASFYGHWNNELVTRLLNEWQVNPDDKVGLLSEGEAQKLMIILALGHEPEILILDEPVASLDPWARRQFLKTVLDIVAQRACTVFFSTHITTDLERVADHVAILKGGIINFSGELGSLKDEVKRLRVTSQKPFAKDFHVAGLIHAQVSENQALLSVRGFTDETKRGLEKKYNAQVVVEDINLEEIFLEINR